MSTLRRTALQRIREYWVGPSKRGLPRCTITDQEVVIEGVDIGAWVVNYDVSKTGAQDVTELSLTMHVRLESIDDLVARRNQQATTELLELQERRARREEECDFDNFV